MSGSTDAATTAPCPDTRSVPARILAVADICDALRASRPYRPGLPLDRVLEIMRRDAGIALDADVFAALTTVLTGGASRRQDVGFRPPAS